MIRTASKGRCSRLESNRAARSRLASGICLAAISLALQLGAVAACRGEAARRDRAESREATGSKPFELVRALESLQDQVVLGNPEAQAKLPKLMGQIGTAVQTAAPDAWDDPRNLRAVIVYAASGGQSRPVRAVAELGVARGETKTLLDGLLAYAEGRDGEAKQVLSPIEAVTLPAPLAGHIAMIQANLVAGEDPRKAMQLLAQARVLAPGTLVEEAALRKEIFLADQIADLDAFAILSSQYLRRFARSAYAANFRQRFRSAVMRFGSTGDRALFARLESVLSLLEPDEELRLLLEIARSGLLGGRIAPARNAAERAVAAAKEGTAEAIRAGLYAALARVLTGDIDAGLADLDSVEAAKVTKPDGELARAVRAMVAAIRTGPAKPVLIGAEQKLAEDGQPENPAGHEDSSAALLIRQAETMLDETEALLERKGF
jgi:chemotaxis protein MotC